MIRILHIVTTMNRGGLETMIMNYYRCIDREKIQFDFLLHTDEETNYEGEISDLGGRIYKISKLNPFSYKYRKEIDFFFKFHKEYSIVHCHLDCMSALPLKYAKKNGVKTRIAHAHNTSQEKNLKCLVKYVYKRIIHMYSTDLFACGENAGKWMFGKKNFTVINNAIDSSKFGFNIRIRNKIRTELNIADKFVVGHVGRFNTQKNHKYLIDIFYELLKINTNSVLLLIGTGELEKELISYAKGKEIIDKIIFYGNCNNVNDLLQGLDIFVFPSLFEGLPVTMIEAQASGLICFMSDHISSECVLTKNVRVLNIDNNPKIWAEEINRYSDGYSRVDQSQSIAFGGYDIKTSVNNLEGLYESRR